MTRTLDVQLPEALAPLWQPKRYKIMYGGRGGGKSIGVAKYLLVSGMQAKMRFLCTREVQKSLKESVHKLLSDEIEVMGLTGFYEVQATSIKGKNGTEFMFAGLQDHTIDSIRSYHGVDKVWIEEAHSVSKRSWDILVPTIRKDGSEIIATMNPVRETDEAYVRFIAHTDPQAWVCKINWSENPFFPEVLDIERQQLRLVNEDLYGHVWEGKCRSIYGLMFKRHWLKRFRDAPENLNNYMASDHAQTPEGDDKNDPDWTEHGCFGLDTHGDVWVHDWWSGQTDLDTSLDAWFAMVRRNKPLVQFDEKGGILNMLSPIRNRMMRERQTFVRCESLASVQSKAFRAQGFAARAAAGTVYIREGAWGDRLVNQLCAFSGRDGQTDDAVDACSLFARGLDFVADAQKPAVDKKATLVPYSADWWALRDRQAEASDTDKQRFYR